MQLEQTILDNVGDHLTTLIGLSNQLLGLLNDESQALGTMQVSEVERLLDEKSLVIEAMTENDTALKAILKDVAKTVGLPLTQILREGQLAQVHCRDIATLKDLRSQIERANQAVQIRASYGLQFFQTVRGTSVSYGAGGESLNMGPSKSHFHQVM